MTEPVVIVGAGAAGLATALALAPRPVVLVCRGASGSGSASELAQGGLAAALDDGDEVEAHFHDTLTAGAFHNDVERTRWLCAQAPGVVRWLEEQGVAFDRDIAGRLLLGREGGHGRARIAHAGGDATGAAIVRALAARAREARHIEWCGGLEVDALGLRDGRVCSVGAQAADGTRVRIEARAVVLATGGLGALYARTSNPPGAVGSGLALALLAGASARDLEFVQFHPTALDVPSQVTLPLITEALRGAGAHLLVGDEAQPLMAGVHPQGDLAPRDVVAREVWRARNRGAAVYLDATGIGSDWQRRFPTVLASCLAHGIDPATTPIPVAPAAHFHMGGIEVDADGRSSLAGLHAVGEVACTGVHGANRLASNSLLEGVAFGRRLGAMLAVERGAAAADGQLRWRQLGPSLSPARMAELRELLWRAAGPERSAAQLAAARDACVGWRTEGWQARLAADILAAALYRGDSLGAHWRSDSGAAASAARRAAAS